MPARSTGRTKREYLKLTRFLEQGNRLLRSDSKTITTMLPMRPAMLVDWLVGSVSRSREASLWELPEFFRRSVSVKKVWGHIFRAESEALAERRGRRPGRARAARNETG